MSSTPKKKIDVKARAPAEYAAHVARVRADFAKRRAEKEQQAGQAGLHNLQAGQHVAGQGIYLCRHIVVGNLGHDGKPLIKMFNVFAAPEDLTDKASGKGVFTYSEAVRRVAELKKWHGFGGADQSDGAAFQKSLLAGAYEGKWIIPPRELLRGNNANKELVQHDNLFAHRQTGALRDTFMTAAASSSFHEWYWSSTEENPTGYVWSVRFDNGVEVMSERDGDRISCRPVRLVEVGAARL